MTAVDRKARLSVPRALALAPLLALCLLGLLLSASAKASGATAVGWGLNVFGEIGTGTTTPPEAKVPEPVKGLAGATQIAAGGEHTLALLANGLVVAWGENSSGGLGDGTISGPDCGGHCRATPVLVPGLANVVAIAAGTGHSLALLADGTVKAWGGNGDGALGVGNTSGPEECQGSSFTIACSKVPIGVPGLANVVAIAANGFHSLALLADGTVVAWGFDEHGETGDGTGTQNVCHCVDEPTPVRGVSGAMAISAGAFGGLALLGDGTVKAWGRDDLHQLGNPTVTPPSGGCECLGPVSVSGLAGAQALAAGGEHNLVMMPGGSVQSWGENFAGQLGQDVFNSCSCSPTPAPVVGLSDPQAIAAGSNHSLTLLATGAVKAWGENLNGDLGDETTKNREIPTAVRGIGGSSAVLTGASGVSAAFRSSFALIGPSQTLKISLAGAGTGAVGGPGILCPAGCEAHYPQGQVENLRAEPSGGSGFAGFAGPCTGTATTCQVRLDQDQTLTATFGPPKGTKITKAKLASAKKSASFSFTAPGAITGFQCMLIRPRRSHRGHNSKVRRTFTRGAHKKPKPRFSRCSAPTNYKHLTPGHYAFKVRALDILGADTHPALKRFTIKSHKAKKAKGHR